ncbi:DNA-binding response OmpR family regulator [Bacilli bacterium PM5-3]|nr:DNA-binding response OmpR family regulator [Bacilli bacterium PM5-3]MDH6604011.1 DNA-binding response OmpR family regulator [Bacilli bacterium PM5-9]
MKKVLFIDDDAEFGKVFTNLLKENNFDVDFVCEVNEGLELEKNNDYELIIIDLYLKKFTGIQIVELIRLNNKKSKIIILTNSIDDHDEIKSLQYGVNEYLRKNTSFFVMLERIKKVIDTPIEEYQEITTLESASENIKVDIKNHTVEHNGNEIHLTYLEFDLLVYFLTNKNILLSRNSILEQVWKLKEDEMFIDSRTIDVHIKNLRKKMKIDSIHSIRGMGYRWHEK